jgi:hypothetical protein
MTPIVFYLFSEFLPNVSEFFRVFSAFFCFFPFYHFSLDSLSQYPDERAQCQALCTLFWQPATTDMIKHVARTIGSHNLIKVRAASDLSKTAGDQAITVKYMRDDMISTVPEGVIDCILPAFFSFSFFLLHLFCFCAAVQWGTNMDTVTRSFGNDTSMTIKTPAQWRKSFNAIMVCTNIF